LFFVDAMQGQDAINTARAFNDRVGVSGLALTKFDGDSRGGAALSARAVTGAPIKFVGVGEKPDDLQPFYPDRFASRILGQGDIASLAEELQNKGDAAALRGAAKLHQKPNSFDLNDQLAQVRQMKKMGGMANVLDKLPGNMAKKLDEMGAGDGRAIVRMEAIILSMTPQERRRPELIKASRKRRIAAGAAVAVPQVNQLLQQHDVAKKMMKRHAKNPLALMRMMGQMFG
jgi:signal recognition particle subunit SRP54